MAKSRKYSCLSSVVKVRALNSKENKSLDIGRVIIDRYHKIYGFMILARNIPGSFYSILETFAKYKLNIIYVSTSKPTFEKYANILLYVDFTSSKVEPKNIVDELKGNANVLTIESIEPVIESVIVDTVHFPLTIGGKRAIVLRKPVFEALIKGFRKKFGTVSEAFLYYIGYEIGREALKSHCQILLSRNLEELVRVSEALFKAVGWGKLKILEYSDNDCFAIAIVEDSFECELAGKTNKPYSQLIRGALAGWFSEMVGKKCSAEETKCIAKGDPYCEFHIKPSVISPTSFT